MPEVPIPLEMWYNSSTSNKCRRIASWAIRRLSHRKGKFSVTTNNIPQNHPAFIDRTGVRYGRLVALKLHGKRGKRLTWLCQCDCSQKIVVVGDDLTSGHSQSCGCLRRESKLTHGMTGTREYISWDTMIQRCHNPNHPKWAFYGARGITVCDRWRNSFEAFLEDMGKRPENHSIDRIDNNKGYFKNNCHWATSAEQQANTRANRYVTFRGKTLTISQWSREYNIDAGTLRNRIVNGWTLERAFSQPVQKHHKSEKTGGCH